jgi:DNA-directed RNA polymerase subunit N (RpoN/RPB10)
MILWAIEPNRFWIFPSHLVDNRHNITLEPQQKWREFDVEVAKTMRANGKSYQEIADHLGIERTLVSRRLTTHKVPKRDLPSMEIRKYEGRWDLIREYASTITEASRVVDQFETVKV